MEPTEKDLMVVEAFKNWLQWAGPPGPHSNMARPVPPAFYAYALGASSWCPPLGEW